MAQSDNKEKKVSKKTTSKNTTKKKTVKKKEVKKVKVEEPIIKEEIKEEKIIPKTKEETNTNKESNWGILGIVILFIIAVVLLGIYSYLVSVHSFNGKDFTLLGRYTEQIFKVDYLKIKNQNDFKDFFPHMNTELDFDNYDYIVIPISYNACSEGNIKPGGYTLDDGILTIRVNYEKSCGYCKNEYLYYLLKLEKNMYFDSVTYDYHSTNRVTCGYDTMVDKPIIYIYPEEKTNVKVTLVNDYLLTSTYPTYNNGWEVVAYPDGTLIDSNNREYYSLFWEGKNHNTSKVYNEGFVIKGEDTKVFLEESLKILGLNDKEANEFIVYWLPKLEVNNYNYIRFESLEEINSYMPIIIEPTPDNIIRIQMDYLPLDKPIDVIEQELITPERGGYTVVEWGGSIIKE